MQSRPIIIAGILCVVCIFIATLTYVHFRIAPERPEKTKSSGFAEISEFVHKYLSAHTRGNIKNMISLYADRVDYFAEKGVNKKFIQKDKTYFYNRWNKVKYSLNSDIKILKRTTAGTRQVQFGIDFFVHNSKRNESRSGKAINTLILKKSREGYQIIKEQQRVIHRNSD